MRAPLVACHNYDIWWMKCAFVDLHLRLTAMNSLLTQDWAWGETGQSGMLVHEMSSTSRPHKHWYIDEKNKIER